MLEMWLNLDPFIRIMTGLFAGLGLGFSLFIYGVRREQCTQTLEKEMGERTEE